MRWLVSSAVFGMMWLGIVVLLVKSYRGMNILMVSSGLFFRATPMWSL